MTIRYNTQTVYIKTKTSSPDKVTLMLLIEINGKTTDKKTLTVGVGPSTGRVRVLYACERKKKKDSQHFLLLSSLS